MILLRVGQFRSFSVNFDYYDGDDKSDNDIDDNGDEDGMDFPRRERASAEYDSQYRRRD